MWREVRAVRSRLLASPGAAIQIDVSSRTLSFLSGGSAQYSFPCGVGKFTTPTPVGNWAIREKVINPSWQVLGSRWMGLNVPWGNYGIHGTSAPWSIGRYISNGCIRLLNQNVELIFPLVSIGTPVHIVGRYPGTAQQGAPAGTPGATPSGPGLPAGGPPSAPAGGYVLRRGSVGADVMRLQQRLPQMGFDPGRPDGLFGSRTEQAVMAFQASRKVRPDGVVGSETRALLGI